LRERHAAVPALQEVMELQQWQRHAAFSVSTRPAVYISSEGILWVIEEPAPLKTHRNLRVQVR